MAPGARSGGFTYIGLIVLLAILGLVAAAGMKTGALMQRAAAEEELLEIGAAFSDALRSYAAATPKGQPTQPPNLDVLLKDPRFPGVRRHLRRIFVDPVTGRAEWGLVTAGDKGVVTGVYSLSDAKPLKIGNFDARFINFDNKERISDWKFTAAGQGILAPGAPLTPPAPVPAVDPAEPVVPVVLVVPVVPAEPVIPAEPAEPVEPVDPAEPVDAPVPPEEVIDPAQDDATETEPVVK